MSSPSLEDRVRAIRAEIDTFIAERLAKELAAHPNTPADVLHNILANRAPGCQCRQYLRLIEQR